MLIDVKRAIQIQQAHAKCPNTKLVASGYSQGGQIVHNAAALLPAAVGSWISSVVIFGDPGALYSTPLSRLMLILIDNGNAIPNVPASKVKTYCNADDDICKNGVLILPAHLTYGLNAVDAANFVTAH